MTSCYSFLPGVRWNEKRTQRKSVQQKRWSVDVPDGPKANGKSGDKEADHGDHDHPVGIAQLGRLSRRLSDGLVDAVADVDEEDGVDNESGEGDQKCKAGCGVCMNGHHSFSFDPHVPMSEPQISRTTWVVRETMMARRAIPAATGCNTRA